jgi:uncharacterized protein with HEPN domain
VRVERAVLRVRDIKRAIVNLRSLLAGKSREDIAEDVHLRAAMERFLEIVSEASRHVPAEWKSAYGPDIHWRSVAALGNILRHAYNKTDLDLLWSIYVDDIDILAGVVDAILRDHPIDL